MRQIVCDENQCTLEPPHHNNGGVRGDNIFQGTEFSSKSYLFPLKSEAQTPKKKLTPKKQPKKKLKRSQTGGGKKNNSKVQKKSKCKRKK